MNLQIGTLMEISAINIAPSLLGIYLSHFPLKNILINIKSKYLISSIYSAVGALSGTWWFYSKNIDAIGLDMSIFSTIPLLITMFLYWFILVVSYITFKKNKFKIPIMLIILVSIMFIGAFVKIQEDSNEKESENKVIPVKAISTHEDAKGMTEENMNLELINDFDSYFKNKLIKTMEQAYIDNGYDPIYVPKNITSRSFYVTIDGKKLAVIIYNLNDIARHTVILGFKNKELLRVNCIKPGDDDILLAAGECNKEIEKTFGVSFSSMDNDK
jgi:hypothetical protein